MQWGQLPANADLDQVIPPIVTPILAPIVEALIPSLPVVQNDDPRLSDARTPLTHTHPQSAITNLTSDLAAKCSNADSRLSDARTPLAHSHAQSDVTGLTAALNAKETTANKGQANGYASLDATGKVPSAQLPASSGSSWTRVALPADVTNNNAAANTLQDVTGLSFPVVAGQRYWFRFRIVYTAQATTTGSRWSINGPAVAGLSYMSEYSLTTTTTTRNTILTAYNLPAASNATSATTGPSNTAIIEGFIQPSANGTVVARFASEVANSAIIAKVGSFLEYTSV